MSAQDHAKAKEKRNPVQIDKRFGKITIVNGEIYYSPNCSRTVEIPEPAFADVKGQEHTIFNRRDAYPQNYHQPRWWTQTFGWISFVQLQPCFTGPIFRRLAHVPTHLDRIEKDDSDGLYALPKSMRESWGRLDSNLRYITSLITKQYKLAAVRPFSPWALGYTEARESRKHTVRLALKSRDWFVMWMGLASYLIAEAESLPPDPLIPTWKQLLVQNGFELTFVEALESTAVCDFSPATKRAGAFVYLQKSPIPQPPVEWFIEKNIPIWYRWSQNERDDPTYLRFAPPPHQLQDLMTSRGIEIPRALLQATQELHHPPARQDDPRRLHNPPPWTANIQQRNAAPVEKSGPPREREYVAFFAARDARNRDRLLTESAKDRQTRLNRERCPPTVSAKVCVWEPSAADPEKWVRVPVPVGAREETLGEYGAAQCRYDSFSNEWDCCDEFGPGNDGDDDFDDDGAGYLLSFASQHDDPSQWPHPPPIVGPRSITPPPRPAQTTDAEPFDVPRFHPIYIDTQEESITNQAPPSKADLFQQEVMEIFILHYGYTPPLPLPSSFPAPSREADRKKLVRLLGMSWHDSQEYIPQRPIAGLAQSYLDGIMTGSRPSYDRCDFNDQSRVSLASSRRLKFLRVVKAANEKGQLLYMFDFGGESKASWKLTMTTAADALMICRLDTRLNEYEIARYLLTRGIPFRTLLPSELAFRGPRELPPPCVLPVRLSGAVFSRKDYDAYATQRFTITGQPRARAALLRGGIIWRICVPTVSFEDVLHGPTGWNPLPGTMFTAQDPLTKALYIDDDLTDIELNLLSGAYTCYTGLGNQIAIESWHPLASTFEAGGEDYGRWNVYREDGFLMRIDELNNPNRPEGSRGPLTAKKWRDLTRGMKEMRRLKHNIELWSEAFLKQHIEH